MSGKITIPDPSYRVLNESVSPDVTMKTTEAKLIELLARKRELNNFIEREARRYPGARSRFNHRQAARQLHGWDELIAEIKSCRTQALTFSPRIDRIE